jgi:hypothetical protein
MGAMEAGPALPRGFFEPAVLGAGGRPRLCVVVDTEEEFDWSAPFSRDAVGVTAIDEVGRLQDVLAAHGLKPTYVIDYPVAATRSSSERLAGMAARRECFVGAHLHPWVSPPYDEPIERRFSYGCNLPPALEHDKIARLVEAIRGNVGVEPRVYKAGRYGFGPSTAQAIETLGFDVDGSVNPLMDFRSDGGPSFEHLTARPARFGRTRPLLELPCTTGFVGAARRAGRTLHRQASRPGLARFRAVGVLARSGLLNKVMLSPEGNTFAEMRALAEALRRDGLEVFSLTLHSPSVKPGCTPYVRTAADRDELLRTIDRFCEFFLGAFGGVPGTPHDLYDEMVRAGAR